MFGLTGHLPELIVLLVAALVIFGPKRLPEIGGAMGKTIKEFRHSSRESDDPHLVDEQHSGSEGQGHTL